MRKEKRGANCDGTITDHRLYEVIKRFSELVKKWNRYDVGVSDKLYM